ncbi:MAG TPA: PIG-L family deacetylase [Acinetobacter lwoffii]|uniref:PIG-L family deacetylase n=1 Tax=Acinetobacter lwoffii TaxID=28090 RepID=A0A9D2ZYP4_ACILW|nr:PIG-L deacetylase family protein [uncultured Acinetobacter sp.]MDM1781978.1 PIG-L family deacetylase [Acinetobacter indicus]HJF27886.1 PIG-L family deacetylase [Acinetobacter lwoffii]
MATLVHEIVGDRVIHGEGTPKEQWLSCPILQQLAAFDIQAIVPMRSRVCIIAPHPDDEILGCGGLIQRLDQAGYPVTIFAVTNGTASHPDSSLYSPAQLDQIRPHETRQALAALKLQQHVERIALQIPDGEVIEQRELLKQRLKAQLQPHDVLVTTFIHDGHPDHEGTAQVIQDLATELQQPCIQVLIWAWHWAQPGDARINWKIAHKLQLSATELSHKRRAAQCFKSQLEMDPTTGQPPILSGHALQRLLQPWEVYLYEQ